MFYRRDRADVDELIILQKREIRLEISGLHGLFACFVVFGLFLAAAGCLQLVGCHHFPVSVMCRRDAC